MASSIKTRSVVQVRGHITEMGWGTQAQTSHRYCKGAMRKLSACRSKGLCCSPGLLCCLLPGLLQRPALDFERQVKLQKETQLVAEPARVKQAVILQVC